jgi:hypothetical protein
MFLRPGAMAEGEGAGSAEAKRRKKEGEDADARRRTAGRRRKGASTDIRGTAGWLSAFKMARFAFERECVRSGCRSTIGSLAALTRCIRARTSHICDVKAKSGCSMAGSEQSLDSARGSTVRIAEGVSAAAWRRLCGCVFAAAAAQHMALLPCPRALSATRCALDGRREYWNAVPGKCG